MLDRVLNKALKNTQQLETVYLNGSFKGRVLKQQQRLDASLALSEINTRRMLC